MPPPATPDTDADMLSRICAGDLTAGAELFARHRSYLRRIAGVRFDGRLRPRVDESDLVQEALTEAIRSAESYLTQRPMAFRLWLRQLLLDAIAAAQRRHLGADCRAAGREVELSADSCADAVTRLIHGAPSPSSAAGRRELEKQVREAVDALPPDDRDIVVLRTFENLTNREAAAALNLTPEAASKRLVRALIRLRAELAARGLSGGSQ